MLLKVRWVCEIYEGNAVKVELCGKLKGKEVKIFLSLPAYLMRRL